MVLLPQIEDDGLLHRVNEIHAELGNQFLRRAEKAREDFRLWAASTNYMHAWAHFRSGEFTAGLELLKLTYFKDQLIPKYSKAFHEYALHVSGGYTRDVLNSELLAMKYDWENHVIARKK